MILMIINVYLCYIISHKNNKHLLKLRNFNFKSYTFLKENLKRRLPLSSSVSTVNKIWSELNDFLNKLYIQNAT